MYILLFIPKFFNFLRLRKLSDGAIDLTYRRGMIRL